ncbi:hypothetical protein H5410_006473 [Solanum commersonii]|uniref:Uncharacterized protein n=1 Tax=Solanum commersonii TaxID=4109 RepID=A0A9J6ABF6_SOLCO|nr:hypothetical protein H5410_006473 [Solanum commersonii]
MLFTNVHVMNVKNALAREHEAIKSVKQRTWRNAHLRRIYLLSNRFLLQADSLKAEREQLRVKEKVH